MAGMVPSSDNEFDWEGDLPLNNPQKDLIIYEMHVRGFTKHDSSNTNFPGTYLGVVEKLDHLKELGINCIELMPCQEYNELEHFTYNSVLGDYKLNFWGYSTINFFSPMLRYSSAGTRNCGRDAINEVKTLVREAHKRGIEVFNYITTPNEGGPKEPLDRVLVGSQGANGSKNIKLFIHGRMILAHLCDEHKGLKTGMCLGTAKQDCN